MGRFGPLTAKFFSPSNLTTALDVGGVSVKYPISGATEDHRDGEGSSTLVFVNDTALNTLAAVGNICWAYKTDSVRDDLGATGVTFCEPFIIRSRVAGPAPNEITISGPDLLTELKRYTIYKPLGALSTTNTTLAANAAAPVTGRTVAQTAVAGAEAIDASSVDGDNDPGKEIRIALNGGGTHVTIVQSINDSGDLVLRDRMPTAASAGNAIELRTRKVNVTTPGSFQEGVEAVVTLNSGSHTTLVAESVTDGDVVTLRDGLTGAANSGNAIQSKDYSGVSTSDITNIMAFVPGWTLEFETGTGTANGTRYPGGGETVYSILRSIVDETGEIFRLKSAEASPVGPKRKVVWRRTHDAAGIAGTVRLVMPSQADMATDTANKNRAILLERPRHAGEYDPVTQIIPIAGDPAVTLFSCSPAAVTAASAAGFEVVTTGLGLYAAPYIKNTALDASIGTHQRRVTFSEVTVEGANSGSIRAAADRMLQLAMGYMKDHVTTAKEIEARCISPVGIRPGQKVELYFVSPTGEYTIDYTAAPLYVQAVRRETANDGDWPGAPITTLSLSPTTTLPPVNSSARDLTGQTRSTLTGGRTLSREIGKRLQAVDRLIVSNNTPSLVTLSVATGGTGGDGGGTPPAPPTDHGSLTGLGDDDHTQYWNTSRGNSAIATHTAIADAHHAAVTAGNSGIGVAGQAVSLALASNAGLELSTGLRVQIPTNGGIMRDSTGIYLTPGTVTATSTNSMSGSSHFHAVTAASNSISTPATLLKSGASGELTVATLGVGAAATSSAALYVKSAAVDDYTLHLKQLSSQTASMLRVESAAGQALIVLTGGGDLESGNPGFVSGLSGWQITATGDAEFNNVSVRGELRAATFVADEMHATGGTLAVMTATSVAPPVNSTDNKLPGFGSTFTLNVVASRTTGLCYFVAGDILRIKHLGKVTSGSSLALHDVYVQVSAIGSLTGNDLANNEPGYYPMTVYRRYGGAANLVLPTGAAVVRWGKVLAGEGTYTGGMILTSDMSQSPYIDIFTIDANQNGSAWQSAPVTPTPRVRLGNLDGVLGLSEQWGLAAGTDLSDTTTAAKYLVASNLGLQLRNIDLKMYSGANVTVELGSTGTLKLGSNTGSAATTGFEFTPSTNTLRVGGTSGTGARMEWNGTDLAIRAYSGASMIRFDSDGSSYFAGPMTLGVSGGIYQGTGDFATPTSGLKIWNSGGKGYISTFVSGSERVSLSDAGLFFYPSGSKTAASGIAYYTAPGGTLMGGFYAWQGSGAATLLMETIYGAHTSKLELSGGTTKRDILLAAGSTQFSLSSSSDYALLHDADLYVKERGIAAGYTSTPSLNRGQFASDFAGEHNFNAVVLQDTVDIAHGMTAIVGTGTYATLGKVTDGTGGGGLEIGGYTKATIAWLGQAYATVANTTAGTSGSGAFTFDAYLKSGTGGGAFGASDNLFVVSNNGSARFIVQGDGDFFYDGTGTAYDSYDDVALLRTLSREAWGGTVASEWDAFIDYNRQNLIDAGVMSAGGFINGAALGRLLTGAIWQLARRVMQIEERNE